MLWDIKRCECNNPCSRSGSKTLSKIPFSNLPDASDTKPIESRQGFWKRELPLEAETCLFILVNALDVFMTYILLSLGEFRESNEMANYFFARWGIRGMVYYKFILVGVVTVTAQIIARKRLGTARYLLNSGSLIIACVVVYSGYLLYVHGELF